MQANDSRSRLYGSSAASQAQAPGLLAKALTLATGAILLVVGVVFSVAILVVAAIVASVILGYLWWKTRDLRKQMRKHPPGGRVIDGESTRQD